MESQLKKKFNVTLQMSCDLWVAAECSVPLYLPGNVLCSRQQISRSLILLFFLLFFFFFPAENILLAVWIERGNLFARKDEPLMVLLEPSHGLLFADAALGPSAACPALLVCYAETWPPQHHMEVHRYQCLGHV